MNIPPVCHHSHPIVEITLGPTWDLNPPAWCKFVIWVINKHNVHGDGHYQVMLLVTKELRSYGLTLTGNKLRGTQSDLTAWMLTYA